MARVLLIFVLCAMLAHAQGPAGQSGVPASGSDAVITIRGLCSGVKNSGAASGECVTVVTRDQFEELLAATSSNGQTYNPAAVRNTANQYIQLLALAAAAEKTGVEKDPKFQELMRVIRLKQLGDAYRRRLEEKYRNPSDQEIADYYQQHSRDFEQITLHRIFIPMNGPGLVKSGPPAKSSATASDDGVEYEKKAAQIVNGLRDRAARGENMDNLQKEGYEKLGFPSAPLSSEFGTYRRGSLPPEQEKDLFALKPGKVSKVYRQPSGFMIFKVDSTGPIPLDRARSEISRTLFRQHVEAALKAATGSIHADLNESYFGTAEVSPSATNAQHSPSPNVSQPK
jgi:parvulin-like peptidyl-prolyl isomerase